MKIKRLLMVLLLISVFLVCNMGTLVQATNQKNTKGTKQSTKLEASVNDVKNIEGNKVLLTNNQLWCFDDSVSKLEKKIATNVKTYLNNVYIANSDNAYSGQTIFDAELILKRNGDLTSRRYKNIKMKKVKKLTKEGFLKKNGTVYKFTYKKGKLSYKKVATKVTDIIQGDFYIKNKKTYRLSNGKFFFKKQVIAKLTSCDAVRVKSKDFYSYYQEKSNKYVFHKINNKKVKSLICTDCYGPVYKATNGKIYNGFGTKKKNSVEIKVLPICNKNLKLKLNKKLYYNGKKILDNVEQIYYLYEDEGALVVRKDGSIWKFTVDENNSREKNVLLTKIRTGKMYAKKL